MDSLKKQNILNINNIAILLSTYNGAKYISELLDSILNQTCQDFTLYIRDDGSIDETVSIIKRFANKSNKIVILSNNGQNMGSKYSFLYMLELIDSNYYMFCDQDDIWRQDKVNDSLKFIKYQEGKYHNLPIIVHTDLKLVDGSLNTLSESFWSYRKYKVSLPHTFNYICHYNDITGCTMMFNKNVKDAYIPYSNLQLPKYLYHDAFLAIVASKSGGVICPLHKSTIIYRRHSDNETNAMSQDLSILKHLSGFKNYINIQRDRHSFFKKIGYGGFLKFLWYRCLYVIRRSI